MKNLFLVIYSSIIIIKLATTNNAFNLIKDGFKQFSNGAKDTLKKVSNSVSNSVSNNYNNLKKVIDSKTSEPRNEIKVI
jgi:gas vesicle protein